MRKYVYIDGHYYLVRYDVDGKEISRELVPEEESFAMFERCFMKFYHGDESDPPKRSLEDIEARAKQLGVAK